MADKRQFPRMPVSFRVSYPSRGALQRDLITDLSSGGVFVRTSKPLPIGTEISLEVAIAAEDPPILVNGRVIWLRETNGPEGMGIQFTGLMGPVLAELVSQVKKG